jgi:hypothetical protein
MADAVAPVEGAHDSEEPGRRERMLELLVAVLLGLAAVATAWAAYQSSQYGGQVLEQFSQANLNISNANAYYSEGDQTYLEDQILFVEYSKALNQDDPDLAAYLHDSLMSTELASAIDWWQQPENIDTYDSPFVDENPNYTISAYDDAAALEDDTDAAFTSGQDAGATGDKFSLITVLLAGSLFVLGITNSFRVTSMRIATICIGATLFIGAAAWMLTLPMA